MNANFPEGEVDKSKLLASASIRSEDDDIFKTGVNRLRKELFGNSTYGLRVIGELKSIGSIKKKDIVSFYAKHFVAKNIVIAVSGDIDVRDVANKLEKMFSGMGQKASPIVEAPVKTAEGASSISLIMEKEQSLIMLGFRTVPRKNPDRYSLEVLGAALSGNSGRLFDELRGRLSLAYTLGCWQESWTGDGMFAFYVATTKEDLLKAREALGLEIDKVKSSGITDEELLQAKRELKSRHQMSLQTNDFFARNFAAEELRGLGYGNIYKYETNIDNVTKEDVKAVANKYFIMDESAEVIIAPR